MNIQGYQKITLLDFPSKVACTVFTGGCNLACPFCHNARLVRAPMAYDSAEAEVLAYLFSKAHGGYGGFFTFNACLCYLAFSVLLFCVTAARACRFSAESTGRDTALLLSRRFLVFTGEMLLLLALSTLLYLLWPQLCQMLS